MIFGDESGYDAFHEATVHLLAPLSGGPSANVPGRPIFPLDVDARRADIYATGAFGEVHHEVLMWPVRFDPAQIRALYATFPTISSLPAPECDRILDALAEIAAREFGGVVERRFGCSIYLTQRR
jgi:hypothetical protein